LAVDGSKFRGVNGKKRNFNLKKLERALRDIDGQVEKYLQELDEEDGRESEGKKVTAEELRKKIDQLKTRKDLYEKLEQDLKESGENQVSLTDPDSRSMLTGKGAEVGYNVQTAVDSKHNLIVEHEVTNDPIDRGHLASMAAKAKETLGVDKLSVVGDMGYSYGEDVKKCVENGITPYVSKPITSANRKLGLFGKERFHYNAEKDVYLCPAKQELGYRFSTTEQGRRIRYYTTAACGQCLLKTQCTRSQGNRRITRWIHEEVLEQMEKRVKENPHIMRQRKAIVEHPFGTLKRWMDQGYFLTRGLAKVGTEMSLSVMAYNMKRMMTILGIRRMIQAV